MEEFLKLVGQFYVSDEVTILSITPMRGGYLLAVRYSWTDGSFSEYALFVAVEQYGRNKGQMRMGWTYKVYESN